MPQSFRVVVGVLSSGEPSLESALGSIAAQRSVDVELIHISDQPQWEAHAQLFARFNEQTAECDLLVKVDADMNIVHPRLIWSIGSMFNTFEDVDLIPVMVDDWLSGSRIWGMNAWRGGVEWTDTPPDLFPDRAPNTVRRALEPIDVGIPLVLHATDPSPRQALRYGAHRALKAKELGTKKPLARLQHLVEFTAEQPELARKLVLVAIHDALGSDSSLGRTYVDGKTDHAVVETAIRRAEEGTFSEIVEEAQRRVDELRLLHPEKQSSQRSNQQRQSLAAGQVPKEFMSRVKERIFPPPPSTNQIMLGYLNQ